MMNQETQTSLITDEFFDDQATSQAREDELNRLAVYMVGEAPDSSLIIDLILESLGLVVPSRQDSPSSSTDQRPTVAVKHPYPPIYCRGVVMDHDRPYADFGHLSQLEIARACRFDVAGIKAAEVRQNTFNQVVVTSTRAWAISCRSRINKHSMIEIIKRSVTNQHDSVDYLCVSGSTVDLNGTQVYDLNIQVIYQRRKKRHISFLDRFVVGHCNYFVTKNDCAWNEYVKKGLDYVEEGTFKSAKSLERKYWYRACPSTDGSTSQRKRRRVRRSMKPTINISDDLFQNSFFIVQTVLKKAVVGVRQALVAICTMSPSEYLAHKQWYWSACQYIHLHAQQINEDVDLKSDVWPDSFSGCSPRLRDSINHWLEHEFVKKVHAKCLVLICRRGCGKTTFARSLPGPINYFDVKSGDIKAWDDFARYAVFDDIPWDRFEHLNYPDKKVLLAQTGSSLTTTDFFLGTITIEMNQPAIVLLTANSNEGSLRALLDGSTTTEAEQLELNFWRDHAIIYEMGPDDHFYHEPIAPPTTSTL